MSTLVWVWNWFTQVLGHDGVDVVANLPRCALELAGGDHFQQVQGYMGPAKAGGIVENGRGAPKGTDDNGDLGLLRDLKDAVAEWLQVTGPAGVAFREDGDAGPIRFQDVHTF